MERLPLSGSAEATIEGEMEGEAARERVSEALRLGEGATLRLTLRLADGVWLVLAPRVALEEALRLPLLV